MARTKRLFNAVDKFAVSMKTRLAEKADLGYSGWNDRVDIIDTELINRMGKKADELRLNVVRNIKPSKKDLVDIANFAMMLHRRC